MRISNLLSGVFALAPTVLSSPVPLDTTVPSSLSDPQTFFLRANCPTAPWHNRPIVALPTSQQLGLENFTVHPETPGLMFRPVRVANGNYALQTSDASAPAYLAALKSTTGTHTASMAIVSVTMLTSHSFTIDADACPEGYDCVIDQWVFGEGVDGVYADFGFTGYRGKWKTVKDAAPEGWHVYWKGDEGVMNPIQLDLVARSG